MIDRIIKHVENAVNYHGKNILIYRDEENIAFTEGRLRESEDLLRYLKNLKKSNIVTMDIESDGRYEISVKCDHSINILSSGTIELVDVNEKEKPEQKFQLYSEGFEKYFEVLFDDESPSFDFEMTKNIIGIPKTILMDMSVSSAKDLRDYLTYWIDHSEKVSEF